ncbi:MAG: FtsX-like permease family protein [Phycisphaerae bacterium]|mgnify:CR=1 FL=1|nr:FtsX-like permease family protein [Phycisphaerae bacterium]
MTALLMFPLFLFRLVLQSAALALSQIWVNKTRSILTTLGIIIGVSSVSAVIAAMEGMNRKILENFEMFGTRKIFIWPEQPSSGPQKNAPTWQLRFEAKHFEGLLEHCPSVEFISLIANAGRVPGRYMNRTVDSVSVTGVDASWFKIENRPIVFGRPFSMLDESQGRYVCIITAQLRDKLQMDRDCSGQIIQLGINSYLVAGVVEDKPNTGMMFGGSDDPMEAYIPYTTAAKLVRMPWIRVMASCRDSTVADEARAEIRFFLRRTRGLRPGEPDNFGVFLMENEVRQFKEVMGMITLVAAGVVSISLLVGGVGIMNIMLVSVSERTREIGLRKAVGARPSAILTQFLVEAVVLCMIGGLIGVGFGHLLASVIANSAPLMEQTQIPAWAIAVSFGFSAFVGVVFGMFPAIKAARLNPIEALRHE